jgi:hypothetical protein
MGLSRQLPILQLRPMHGNRERYKRLLRDQSPVRVRATTARCLSRPILSGAEGPGLPQNTKALVGHRHHDNLGLGHRRVCDLLTHTLAPAKPRCCGIALNATSAREAGDGVVAARRKHRIDLFAERRWAGPEPGVCRVRQWPEQIDGRWAR